MRTVAKKYYHICDRKYVYKIGHCWVCISDLVYYSEVRINCKWNPGLVVMGGDSCP